MNVWSFSAIVLSECYQGVVQALFHNIAFSPTSQSADWPSYLMYLSLDNTLVYASIVAHSLILDFHSDWVVSFLS